MHTYLVAFTMDREAGSRYNEPRWVIVKLNGGRAERSVNESRFARRLNKQSAV